MAEALPQPPVAQRISVEDGKVTISLPLQPRKRVVSVKLEETLVEMLDDLWRSLGYQNRSEFIREAIVWYMAAVRAIARGLCVCDCSQPGARRIEDALPEA